MYKLFPAAHAMEFSVGCHARWSNFVEKSLGFPLPSAPAFSAPVQYLPKDERWRGWNFAKGEVGWSSLPMWQKESGTWCERHLPLLTARVKEVSVLAGLVGLATWRLYGFQSQQKKKKLVRLEKNGVGWWKHACAYTYYQLVTSHLCWMFGNPTNVHIRLIKET